MKIGITGANGFVSWHMKCFLHTLGDQIEEVRLAFRSTFACESELVEFVEGLDVIVHLAGVNRAVDDDIVKGNLNPAKQLVSALDSVSSAATVLYANTTHSVNPVTVYGETKSRVAAIFREWSDLSKGRFINLIIPHVFGEYSKPFYNSGVATFCYQITQNESPEINPDGDFELVHVQDLVESILDLAKQDFQGDFRVNGHRISVPELIEILYNFEQEYLQNKRLPELSDSFRRDLFNTFRSFIDYPDRNMPAEMRSDNRGWLVETVKANSGGQCFVSSTHSGITRGNHYHRRKVERFFVLQGKGEIKLRKLFTDEVFSYKLDGQKPAFIDIPTLHTHNITNVGDNELITLFWADEFYDPENPDTFFEKME